MPKQKNKNLDEETKAVEAKEDQDEDVIVVQEATKISDGIHEGKIKNIVREKRQGFDYVDVYVDLPDDNDNYVTIKTGFPSYISANSSFGRFLEESGFVLKAGASLKLSEIKLKLVGMNITFQTIKEDQFAKIINKTIRFPRLRTQ